MNLLPVKELNTRVNDQKKSEAEAGMFLAKKVDALREQVADAQLEHETVVKAIKEEEIKLFGEFAAKKGNLEREIESLEVKRAQLLVPLDAEWSKVNELIRKTSETVRIYDEKGRKLSERESDILQRENNVQEAEILTKNSLSEAKKAEENAKKVLDEVKILANESRIARLKIETEEKQSLAKTKENERKLAYEIKHYQDFSKRLKEKEKELVTRETRVSIKENATHNR